MVIAMVLEGAGQVGKNKMAAAFLVTMCILYSLSSLISVRKAFQLGMNGQEDPCTGLPWMGWFS